MKQSTSINQVNESHGSVRQAELMANGSLNRVESAIDSLTNKIDATNSKVQRYQSYLDKPRRWMQQGLETAAPYYEQTRVYAEQTARRIERDPKPYAITAFGVLLGYMLLKRR